MCANAERQRGVRKARKEKVGRRVGGRGERYEGKERRTEKENGEGKAKERGTRAKGRKNVSFRFLANSRSDKNHTQIKKKPTSNRKTNALTISVPVI